MIRLASLLLTALLAGCASAPAATAPPTATAAPVVTIVPTVAAVTHTLKGTFQLRPDGPPYPLKSDTDCQGQGGFSDIRVGAPVTVRDGSGNILGLSQLEYLESRNVITCYYSFNVPALPDVPFYSIEVSARGPIPYSKADLDAVNWTVQLTLGDG